MTRHAVSVLIVDDQAPFRSAARAVLAMSPGFQPVAEAESGEAAVAAATELAPELVLMDIHLPGINGIEATRRILRAHPATVVILLSTYPAADLPPEAASPAPPPTSTRRTSTLACSARSGTRIRTTGPPVANR